MAKSLRFLVYGRKEKTQPVVLQIIVWTLGLVMLVWGCLDPRFRDAEGSLQTGFCLILAVSIALMIVAAGMGSRLERTSFWFALALVGQAVSLQLVDAGIHIKYQHYRPMGELTHGTSFFLLAFIVIQAALVVIALRSRWRMMLGWLRRSFKWWQLVGVAFLFLIPSAALSRQIPVYATELLLAMFVQLVNLGNVLLIAWSEELTHWRTGALTRWRAQQSECSGVKEAGLRHFMSLEPLNPSTHNPQSAADEVQRVSARRHWFVLAMALWVLVVTSMLNLFVYQRHPHLQDEAAYLVQARYFADGALSVAAPPAPEAFGFFLMKVSGDRWYAVTPPGWPAALALGVLTGVPWLVNPLLAALNVLLVYFLLRRLYTEKLARYAVILMSCSPWYLFLAMSFMNHILALTCVLVALLCVDLARQTSKLSWAFLAGAAIGVSSLIRPLDGAITAAFVGLWAIGFGGRRLRLTCIGMLILATIMVGSLQLLYNARLTGEFLNFPVVTYFDDLFGPKANAYGFGPERGMGWPLDPFPGHGPLDGMVNAGLNLFSLNIELFGWGTGSLLLIGLMIFAGSLQRADRFMLLIAGTTVVAYFFYYFGGGPDFGARYWFLMFVPCIALTVRGMEHLRDKLGSTDSERTLRVSRGYTAVIALCVLSTLNYLPWRSIDKYHHYLGMRPDVIDLAERYDFGNSLVLIQGKKYPDYTSAAVYNPLDWHGKGTIYAWDKNAEVRNRVLAAFPDRPVWVVEGPTLTRGPYRVKREEVVDLPSDTIHPHSMEP